MGGAGKLTTYLTAAVSSVPRLIHDEFLVCTVPQRLVIQHAKLGILLRCMQVAMVIGVLFRLLTQQVWLKTSTPTTFAPLLYTEGGEAGAVQNDNVAHCRDISSYWFKYDEYWGFYPQRCEALEPGEVSVQRSSEHMFFPTYIMDTTVVKSTGAACVATREWCNSTKGVLQESSSGCSCTTGDEFFAKNQEHQRLGIFHGYEVDTSDGEGKWVMRGKSESPFVWEGPRHDMKDHEGNLLTVILSQEGLPCKVDGRSTWTYEQAQWGIEGTLGDWMACAGVTLDTNPRTLVKANGLPKHLRTMGLSLQLTFDYRNTHDLGHDGVVCFVTVNALAQWSQIMPPTDAIWIGDKAQTAKRTRLAFGAAINMKVTGSFKTFSLSYLILYLVETVIVFKLPLVVTQVVALYFMGFLSTIYRRARQVKFNIFTHYRESIAKLVQAEVAFRSLVGGVWRGSVANKEMPMRLLYLHLCDAFDYHMKNGTLTKAELRQMTTAIFCHLDFEGDGMIGCSDFVRSCTEHDVFDLMTVAKILTGHRDGKDGGILHRLSDQSQQTNQIPPFDSPTEKRHEEWFWDDDEPGKEPLEPLDVTQPCGPALIPAPVASWDGSSPTSAPLRDALQRIEALESLRIGQRFLALEENVVASHEAAKVNTGPPNMPSFGQLKADGPQHQDLFHRILLLESSLAQLGEAVDQRFNELQAKLLPPKAQSADDGIPATGKLRQVVASWQLSSDSSVVDEIPGASTDRHERTRWTPQPVPPIMTVVDQAMQSMPPLGRRISRSVSPGADEAGGVTRHRSREGPPEQRQHRSGGSGDHASVRPHTPSLERRPLQQCSSHDTGESSSFAAKSESAASAYRMEPRIPILGFGESIPIELLDMKEHKRF